MGTGTGGHWDHCIYIPRFGRTDIRTAYENITSRCHWHLSDGSGISDHRRHYHDRARKAVSVVFAYKNGITNAFLCSFYRVATLGSGSGVAAIIYLGEHGIEYGGDLDCI